MEHIGGLQKVDRAEYVVDDADHVLLVEFLRTSVRQYSLQVLLDVLHHQKDALECLQVFLGFCIDDNVQQLSCEYVTRHLGQIVK